MQLVQRFAQAGSNLFRRDGWCSRNISLLVLWPSEVFSIPGLPQETRLLLPAFYSPVFRLPSATPGLGIPYFPPSLVGFGFRTPSSSFFMEPNAHCAQVCFSGGGFATGISHVGAGVSDTSVPDAPISGGSLSPYSLASRCASSTLWICSSSAVPLM